MTKTTKTTKLEYRNLATVTAIADAQSDNVGEYQVEGYAANFQPYVLYEFDGVTVHEQIDRRAFEGADLSDVIMQYDHTGRVLARNSNGSLDITIDDNGLKMSADLSGSNASRELHNDIAQGLVTKMSWGFTVAEDEFDRKTRTRHIKKIKKVYDVSAVSIPANDSTEIQARSYIKDVVDFENKEERSKQQQRLRLKIKSTI